MSNRNAKKNKNRNHNNSVTEESIMEKNKKTVENSVTAIESESASEPDISKKSTPRRRRKRRKHDRKFVPNFDIPGVHKIILNEETQNNIGCVAGDTVTAEKPWINVDKDLIQDSLELRESSEFLPIKDEILEFPGSEVLMGYIPDESKDYDEFYICVTEEATEAVNEIIEKLKRIQEEKLKNAIHKKIKRWKPLGSDKEVEENMIKYNRPLIEVEIESKYPILPFKIHFRLVKTHDMRDGYMELRPTDDALSAIFRKRVDAFVQVAPSMTTHEAQTACSYPTNSYTQYEYEIPANMVISEECMKNFEAYMSKNMDPLYDLLRVNGCIDLYSNDYENLVLDPRFTVDVSMPPAKEYLCFIDMELCGGKMISSLCWHPMWTGIFICSYVDIAPPMYINYKITTDEVHRAVHDSKPVLFWSFKDDLKPKLILETPREVYALSCCPYDENLVIGGCRNGQIIIWDITNKLNNVEEEEIISVNQQKYRIYMHSLMGWMKNIFDLARVRPTALSDLKHSHGGCVNSIFWMSPFHTVSKTGKIELLDEDQGHSLQLMTSAEDGTILIWDLLKKPVVAPGGFKAIRKMRRLKKRPSALLVDESPYKKLHLNLKPIYKINLLHTLENHRVLRISSFYAIFFDTVYELLTRESRKNMKITDRLIYNPLLHVDNSSPRKTFYAGTMEGDFIQATWEGQEFDSGEIVNWEDCQFVSHGKYHDGPIVSVTYSTVTHTILSVGGKIFAFWREDFKDRPILWRKGKSIYTGGSWYCFDQASIKLIRIDGYIERWTLFQKSKVPLNVDLMSNGGINLIETHPRRIKYNVYGIGDYRGSMRLFYVGHQNPDIINLKSESMNTFFSMEIERKTDFLDWQSSWNKRYASKLDVKTDEESAAEIVEIIEVKRKEEKKKFVKISPGQRYLETVQEQHRINEQARIKSIILKKKQLDTDDLLKKREPLRKLEEENEIKKRKQKNKLRDSDKIFKDTVAMLFPDIVKEKPAPPPDPYQDSYPEEDKTDAFTQFQQLSIEAQDYVEDNPFNYDFSWGVVLKTGRERRKRLDDSYDKAGHRKRYAQIKAQKARDAAAALAEAERMSSDKSSAFSRMSSPHESFAFQ